MDIDALGNRDENMEPKRRKQRRRLGDARRRERLEGAA
jgi:hypothetical protein